MKTGFYSCCVCYLDLESFKDIMFYGKESTITEEVQAEQKTKELTKFKDLMVDDVGEGFSVSRGGGKGYQKNSKGDDERSTCA